MNNLEQTQYRYTVKVFHFFNDYTDKDLEQFINKSVDNGPPSTRVCHMQYMAKGIQIILESPITPIN